MSNGIQKTLPNALTVARLIVSVAFFAVLSLYQYPSESPFLLHTALILFIAAAITDWLDGALARRWNATSTFGRIMDPVCDKVLVIGAFVFLAGPMFAEPHSFQPGADHPRVLAMVSGIYPWMVVIILGRELLVTAIRGLMESQGVAFGASWSGKAKMVLQSFSIPIVLFLIVRFDPQHNETAQIIRDVVVYLTLLVTVISGGPYVSRAIKDLSQPD